MDSFGKYLADNYISTSVHPTIGDIMITTVTDLLDLFGVIVTKNLSEFFIYGDPSENKWIVTDSKIINPELKKAYAMDEGKKHLILSIKKIDY